MLSELYKTAPQGKTLETELYPTIYNRHAWESLPSVNYWITQGDNILENMRKPEPLPLTLWLDYFKTGNRANFQKVYYNRRRILCALTLAECVTNRGKYLPALIDYLWAICHEATWNLPAHNYPQYRANYQDENSSIPDSRYHIIDLFAAETSATVSLTYTLLGDTMEHYAPGIKNAIARIMEERIFVPYLNYYYRWMGNGKSHVNNWTTWCTQNILVSAIAMKSQEELSPYIEQAVRSLDYFLDSYGLDGCCDEGAQYFRRSGLCLYDSVSLLCTIMPGVFDSVWKEFKIKNIAEFIANVHIDGPSYLNFADCSPFAGRRDIQDYLFAKKVKSPALFALATADIKEALNSADPYRLYDRDNCEGTNLHLILQMVFHESEVCSQTLPPLIHQKNLWYPSVGLLICRANGYTLGVKAGNNDDSHNHNDTGSVTLYKNGKPLLIDVGVETYTEKTFGPQRYEIWTMQSSWHNLPEFDPHGDAYMQIPGAAACATDVDVNDERDTISMQLVNAYGPVGAIKGLTSYTRKVHLDQEGLHMQDHTDYPKEVALTLMSVEEPTIHGTSLNFGTLANATFLGVTQIEVQKIPITDSRLRWSWPEHIYRTRLYFASALDIVVK